MQTNFDKSKTAAGTRGVNAVGPVIIRRKIGSITYEVEVHFDSDSRETFNDKRLRLMRRDMDRAAA
jgi:ribosomal protein S10